MENIAVSFANLSGGGFILFIALVLRFMKGSEGLLAGYNTMNIKEQAKWNVVKLRIFTANVLIISSCVLLIAGVIALVGFYPTLVVSISWGLFIVLIIFCVIYCNTSSKFKV